MHDIALNNFVVFGIRALCTCRWFTGTLSSLIWQVVWCHCSRPDCSPAHSTSNTSIPLKVRS